MLILWIELLRIFRHFVSWFNGPALLVTKLIIMSAPTLVAVPGSQPCRAVKWMLSANNITFELKSIGWQDLQTAEFEAINFLGTVPALQVDRDGTPATIVESGAILTYLGLKYNTPDFPVEPIKLAKVNEALLKHDYLTRQVTMKIIRPIVMGYFFSKVPMDQTKAVIEKDLPAVEGSLSFVEKTLATQPYIAGQEFTIADYLVVSEVNQLELVQQFLPTAFSLQAKFPNIVAHTERCKAQPGYDAAFAEAKGTFDALFAALNDNGASV
jgi:glutathione S-transferase